MTIDKTTARSSCPSFAAVAAMVSALAVGDALCSPLAAISIFKAPEPEIAFGGSSRDTEPGVEVLRDRDSLAAAVEVLDPEPAEPLPSTRKRTVLRVVGRERENLCRETLLREVSTRGSQATVVVEERSPEAGCSCGGATRPPRAWLVTVSRAVRRAEVDLRETVVPCDLALEGAAAEGPVMLLEGSWDEPPGATFVDDPDGYRSLLARLRLSDRGPDVDFASHSVAVVTGRSRSNGCRRTRAVAAEVDSSGGRSELVVTLEETYPAPRTLCAQQFRLPRVFLYRVPASVSGARVSTREVRPTR